MVEVSGLPDGKGLPMSVNLNERGVVGTQAEGGVTDISLANAKILLEQYGTPSKITCRYDKDDGHLVEAEWDQGVWTFSGFAWGYRGSGPQGLVTFLDQCGIEEPIEVLDHNREEITYTYFSPEGSHRTLTE